MPVNFEDDRTILDDWRLLRRINRAWIVPDGQGGTRVTSQAFQNLSRDPPALSVHLENVLQERGLQIVSVLDGMPTHSLVAIYAGVVRAHSQVVQRAPEDAEPAHAHVVGDKSKSAKSRLAEAAVWIFQAPSD